MAPAYFLSSLKIIQIGPTGPGTNLFNHDEDISIPS